MCSTAKKMHSLKSLNDAEIYPETFNLYHEAGKFVIIFVL